jgi:hypothetical protein
MASTSKIEAAVAGLLFAALGLFPVCVALATLGGGR